MDKRAVSRAEEVTQPIYRAKSEILSLKKKIRQNRIHWEFQGYFRNNLFTDINMQYFEKVGMQRNIPSSGELKN